MVRQAIERYLKTEAHPPEYYVKSEKENGPRTRSNAPESLTASPAQWRREHMALTIVALYFIAPALVAVGCGR